MTNTPPDQPIIPTTIAVKLFQELDVLFGQTAQEICQADIESGTIAECGQRETLLRRLAVVVKARQIIELMENSLLGTADADPKVSQVAIAAAMGVTQQAVSYRIARLRGSR